MDWVEGGRGEGPENACEARLTCEARLANRGVWLLLMSLVGGYAWGGGVFPSLGVSDVPH